MVLGNWELSVSEYLLSNYILKYYNTIIYKLKVK